MSIRRYIQDHEPTLNYVVTVSQYTFGKHYMQTGIDVFSAHFFQGLFEDLSCTLGAILFFQVPERLSWKSSQYNRVPKKAFSVMRFKTECKISTPFEWMIKRVTMRGRNDNRWKKKKGKETKWRRPKCYKNGPTEVFKCLILRWERAGEPLRKLPISWEAKAITCHRSGSMFWGYFKFIFSLFYYCFLLFCFSSQCRNHHNLRAIHVQVLWSLFIRYKRPANPFFPPQ